MTASWAEVKAEMDAAFAKFGAQTTVPDVDQVLMNREGGCTAQRMAEEYEIPTAGHAKSITDRKFIRGQGTWGHILVEEIAEAIEAATVEGPGRLRAELIQVAAVALRWCDAIDERAALEAADPRWVETAFLPSVRYAVTWDEGRDGWAVSTLDDRGAFS
jgi:hypothetical protein